VEFVVVRKARLLELQAQCQTALEKRTPQRLSTAPEDFGEPVVSLRAVNYELCELVRRLVESEL
jgi:hypothetical protein